MSLTSYRAAPSRGDFALMFILVRVYRLERYVFVVFSRFGGDLLSHVLRRSTIGATALNDRVRNGSGCFARAMTTKLKKKHQNPSQTALCSSPIPTRSRASTRSNQAYRTISTGQLNALLRLHLRPIDVVVYDGSQGYLVLRGASRLDAFSGYPFRS